MLLLLVLRRKEKVAVTFYRVLVVRTPSVGRNEILDVRKSTASEYEFIVSLDGVVEANGWVWVIQSPILIAIFTSRDAPIPILTESNRGS